MRADRVPQLLLGYFIENNYVFPDIAKSDIIFFQWWNDQYDIVIQFDEVATMIKPDTLMEDSDYLRSLIYVHLFLRDYNVYAENPQLEESIEDVDLKKELNESSKTAQLIDYISNLIKANPYALEAQGIGEMELTGQPFEVPIDSFGTKDIFHFIIPVTLIYCES